MQLNPPEALYRAIDGAEGRLAHRRRGDDGMDGRGSRDGKRAEPRG
jgi:hypothetical protein